MKRAIRLVHSILRLGRNVAFDLRYGGFLGGTVYARHAGARPAGNTDYALMGQLFAGRIRGDDVLVDVGCGKGRVLNWWLRYHGSNRIVGLELLDDVARKTKARLRRYSNVEVIEGDAIANLPRDGTLFFLFNPFDAATMTRFKARLGELCQENPNRRVLYFAPLHLDVFSNDPEWLVTTHSIAAPAAGKFEDRHRHLAEITRRRA